MRIIGAYELKSGKEQCVGTWETAKECASALNITLGGVYKRLAIGRREMKPRRGGPTPKYYLMWVDIHNNHEEEIA